MPIVAAHIKLYESSGGNLGGAIGVSETSDTVDLFFDAVSSAESLSGDNEYRCFFVKNENGSGLVLQSPKIYMDNSTPSPDTTMRIGLDLNGLSADADIIGNESTPPPAGIQWKSGVGALNALEPVDIPDGGYIGVWMWREVLAGATVFATDGVTIRVDGQTAA